MRNKKFTIDPSLQKKLEDFHTTLTRESAPRIVAVGEISLSYAVRVSLLIGVAEMTELWPSGLDWSRYESAGSREAPPVALNIRAPEWLWERVAQEGEKLGSPSMRASFRAALALGLGV